MRTPTVLNFFSNSRNLASPYLEDDMSGMNEYLIYHIFGVYQSLFGCHMVRLSKNPDAKSCREGAEKACRIIAKSFTHIARELAIDLESKSFSTSEKGNDK